MSITDETISKIKKLIADQKKVTKLMESMVDKSGKVVEDTALARVHKKIAEGEGYDHISEELESLQKQLKDLRLRETSTVLNSYVEKNKGRRDKDFHFTVPPFTFVQDNRQRLKILFCHDVVINSRKFSTEQDLENLHKEAIKKLDDCEIPLPDLVTAFSTAYRFCQKNDKLNSHNNRVKIVDFYKYFRMGLVHNQLESDEKKDFATWQTSLPQYAYRHNIGRYVNNVNQTDEENILMVSHSSQADTAKYGVPLLIAPGQTIMKYTFLGPR